MSFRKYLILIGIILALSILTVSLWLVSVISFRGKMQNMPLNSLSQDIQIPSDSNFQKLIKGKHLTLEFQANENNLGTVELLLNNYGKINKDVLYFRIKEKDSSGWYYQNTYETAKMDSGKFYPFGFSPVANSAGRNYVIDIESLNGTSDDAVSLNTLPGFFQAKYSFPKSHLLENKKLIPHFISSKIRNCLVFLSPKDFTDFYVAFILPFVVVLPILITWSKIKKGLIKNAIAFKKDIYSNKNIVILLGFYLLTHLPFLSYRQYWDAYLYWHSLLGGAWRFQASFLNSGSLIKSFFETFNLIGHHSAAYGALMLIPQFLHFGDVRILNIENMLLAMLAIYAFYKIVFYFYPHKEFENLLITAIFAFNPLFYATSISFGLDFPVLVFEILMVAALVYKKYAWFSFWAIMLIFSKEVGILIYFTFLLSYFLLFLFRWWRKSVEKINGRRVLAWLLPVFLLGVYFLFSRGNIWGYKVGANIQTSNFLCNGNEMFCFGLSLTNIRTRLVEILIMNFAWLMTLTVIISCLRALLFKKPLFYSLSKQKTELVIVLASALFVFVLFNLFYIVMGFARYMVAAEFFSVLFFYLSLKSLLAKKYVLRITVLLIFLILTFIQVFRAIDPSIRILYGANQMGKNLGSPFFSYYDGLVFNAQFVYVDKLSEKIAKLSKEGTPLVYDRATEYIFNHLNFVGSDKDLDRLKKSGIKKLRYVFIPWLPNKEDRLKKVQELYSIEAKRTFEYDGYNVEVYDLEAK